MKRAAIEKPRTKRVWMEHLRLNHDWPAKVVECRCDLQTGRFRKAQRRAGCLNARCFLCHGAKLLGLKTLFERKAAAEQRDGLAEL